MKPVKMFPQSCQGCDGVYGHWDGTKLYSGGCMKSFGNHYCTKGRKHFKLLKRNLYQLRPDKCPIQKEYPILCESDSDD